MMRIRIRAGKVSREAELNDSPTAQKIAAALPITGRASRWGEEIYFSIEVQDDEAADAREEMAVGEIAYWAPGTAFCIFWGKTPASTGSEPRAASPVNVLGKIDGDATLFGSIKGGEIVVIEKV